MKSRRGTSSKRKSPQCCVALACRRRVVIPRHATARARTAPLLVRPTVESHRAKVVLFLSWLHFFPRRLSPRLCTAATAIRATRETPSARPSVRPSVQIVRTEMMAGMAASGWRVCEQAPPDASHRPQRPQPGKLQLETASPNVHRAAMCIQGRDSVAFSSLPSLRSEG